MINFKISGGNKGSVINIKKQYEIDGVLYTEVFVKLKEAQIPEKFSLHWNISAKDVYSVWSPSIRHNHQLSPNFRMQTTDSRLASWMPLHSILSIDGKNRITIALSDTLNPICIATGVIEETSEIECRIDFFTSLVAQINEYIVTIRIDMRDKMYYDCITDAVIWWEEVCGYKSAVVPEYACLPMNSIWYSYHQNIKTDEIINECMLSKKLGMDTLIVDDGWQTDDNSRGYAYCGDWEVAISKVLDMKELVQRVHNTGMKIMLWYAVPFIGIHSKNYGRFKDMILDGTGDGTQYWALDPRYKEVRDFLIDTYVTALKNWRLDGLKLDFIDGFYLRGKSLEYDERRDFLSLESAIDRLMTDISVNLRAIKPDVMIEFRQSYIGPAIRKYGNILRVGDCPNDAIVNRYDVVSLRLTSGKTAVHSDMLMWNYDDSVESAALQFAAVLYSVPQVSVKLAELSEPHKKMVRHYLGFWREHKDVLLNGKICALNPESNYSIVWSEKNNEAIFTSYTERIIPCSVYKKVIAVNSSGFNELILHGAKERLYRVIDCMGNTVENGTVTADLMSVNVPLGGMVFINYF